MMTLTRIPALSLLNARMLVEQAGSASAVVEQHNHVRDIVPDAGERIVKALADIGQARRRAEAERRRRDLQLLRGRHARL